MAFTELYVLGLSCKIVSCLAISYRFILLKVLDSLYDHVREEDESIDQADWDKVFEALKDDVYWYGSWYAMHKVDFYQYLTIPVYVICDAIAILYIPFTMFGAMNVCSVIFYQIMLIQILNDTVDWNEWMAVAFLAVTTALMCIFAPAPGEIYNLDNTWDDAGFNTGAESFIWIVLLIIVKTYSFYYLDREMKEIIRQKDDEIISDHYQPRPRSWYNLMGPVHLGTNGAIFVVIVKFVMNLLTDSGFAGAVIASVGMFVFAGVGCSFLGYHDYHDIIGELHSATVFPMFILLQSGLSILSGIINFMEKPSNEAGFWGSFSMLMIALVLFVEVMEYNEPIDLYDNEKEEGEAITVSVEDDIDVKDKVEAKEIEIDDVVEKIEDDEAKEHSFSEYDEPDTEEYARKYGSFDNGARKEETLVQKSSTQDSTDV